MYGVRSAQMNVWIGWYPMLSVPEEVRTRSIWTPETARHFILSELNGATQFSKYCFSCSKDRQCVYMKM